MRAYRLRSYDGPSALELTEVAAPRPAGDELLVAVRAIGINFPDLLMTRGQYQFKPDLPTVPGCEIAGTVISAPAGSTWSPGDAVSAFVWQGAYAEQAVVPVDRAAPVPPSVTHTEAAAMIVNYHTVLFALERRAGLRSGETTLVLGAAGGIGSAAVQVARALGARVIAGVADDAQAETARAAGAHEVLVLEPGFATSLRARHGRGIDVVVDPLGDWLFDEAIRCLDPEGRLVVLGFAAGRIPTLAVNRLLLRNVAVVGAAWGAFLDLEPTLVARQAARLDSLRAAGHLVPHVDREFAFEDLPDALNLLSRGEIRGKAVVAVGRPTGATTSTENPTPNHNPRRDR